MIALATIAVRTMASPGEGVACAELDRAAEQIYQDYLETAEILDQSQPGVACRGEPVFVAISTVWEEPRVRAQWFFSVCRSSANSMEWVQGSVWRRWADGLLTPSSGRRSGKVHVQGVTTGSFNQIAYEDLTWLLQLQDPFGQPLVSSIGRATHSVDAIYSWASGRRRQAVRSLTCRPFPVPTGLLFGDVVFADDPVASLAERRQTFGK